MAGLDSEVRTEAFDKDVFNDVDDDGGEGVNDDSAGRWPSISERWLNAESDLYLAFRVRLDTGPLGKVESADLRAVVQRLVVPVERSDLRVLRVQDLVALANRGGGDHMERLMFVVVGQCVEQPQRMVWRLASALIRLYLKEHQACITRDALETPSAAPRPRCSPVRTALPEFPPVLIDRECHSFGGERIAALRGQLVGQVIERGVEVVEQFSDEQGPLGRDWLHAFETDDPYLPPLPFTFCLSEKSVGASFSPGFNRVVKLFEQSIRAPQLRADTR